MTCVQACCHPQVVRREDSLMGGSKHLGMADIMGRLVMRAFHDYDGALQRLVKARVTHAAVLLTFGKPGALLGRWRSCEARVWVL